MCSAIGYRPLLPPLPPLHPRRGRRVSAPCAPECAEFPPPVLPSVLSFCPLCSRVCRVSASCVPECAEFPSLVLPSVPSFCPLCSRVCRVSVPLCSRVSRVSICRTLESFSARLPVRRCCWKWWEIRALVVSDQALCIT